MGLGVRLGLRELARGGRWELEEWNFVSLNSAWRVLDEWCVALEMLAGCGRKQGLMALATTCDCACA